MMSREQNDFITRTGPGDPAGRLMRRYWQPVALVEEFAGDARPIKAVKLLGEHFVLFRTQAGRFSLMHRHCPHRGADPAFGRLEPQGLRCAFHGWLFDADGQCLETPAEPVTSKLCRHLKHAAFPVVERSGILWAYLGSETPPAFPDFDCFVAPDAYTFAFKGLIECNWLQALEVGIDPAHASFLHRFFEDEDPDAAYGKQFRATSADSDLTMTEVLRTFDRPEIEVEATDFGLRLVTLRHLDENSTHVRVTNQVFPHGFAIPLSEDMTITQWHVPVDDENCYWYAVFTSFSNPVDKVLMREQRLELYELPDYVSRRNKRNDYGFDPAEQARATYTGMGHDINVHDQWAVESMGAIQDRTNEHLGHTDKGIALYRRRLRQEIIAAEEGKAPLLALDAQAAAQMHGPATVDGVSARDDWQRYWPDADARRRDNAPWRTVAKASDD
ncbi:MAG TPA: aromatic ring-hydroxylating dioxygenase subunit alpha [Sphingobium sp.]